MSSWECSRVSLDFKSECCCTSRPSLGSCFLVVCKILGVHSLVWSLWAEKAELWGLGVFFGCIFHSVAPSDLSVHVTHYRAWNMPEKWLVDVACRSSPQKWPQQQQLQHRASSCSNSWWQMSPFWNVQSHLWHFYFDLVLISLLFFFKFQQITMLIQINPVTSEGQHYLDASLQPFPNGSWNGTWKILWF